MISRALQTAKKGAINFGSSGGGSYGGGHNLYGSGGSHRLPGSEMDYRAEAGNPWENGIVASCVSWATRCFPEATLVMESLDDDGEWQRIDWHPILDLFMRPNKYYDQSLLHSGMILSRMVDGNGYWYIERGPFGVTGLYYLPHFTVWPIYDATGADFIKCYAYRPVGVSQTAYLKVEDVFHSRYGVNPLDTRRGLSPIQSLVREICADNEAATAAVASMRNMGIIGVMFTPSVDIGSQDPDDLAKLQELGQEKFTGERRGQFHVSSLPGKFEQIGVDPSKMVFDLIRRLPEERVTGCFGIPAVVAGMGAGLDRSTFNNFQEARKAAYESFLCPLWDTIGQEITLQIVPLFGQDPRRIRVRFDYSKVKALQEDQNALHTRVREDYKARIINLAQALIAIGEKPEPGDEKVYYMADRESTTENITPGKQQRDMPAAPLQKAS